MSAFHTLAGSASRAALSIVDRLGSSPPLAPRLQRWLMHQRHNLVYEGRADDLFLIGFPRSGLTLLRMLVYQLTTDGSLELDHISRFTPSFEHQALPDLARRGVSLDALPAPRVMTSQLSYALIPKGPGRYIYVMRHGLDVAVSRYRQRRARLHIDVTFRNFLENSLARRQEDDWFGHVAGWLSNPRALNVLYVSFENLVGDFSREARRVADFCGCPPALADWPRIGSRCGFAVMRAHERAFDVPPARPRGIAAEDLRFIRRGETGQGRAMLPDAVRQQYEAEFDRRLAGAPLAAPLRG